MMKAIPLNPNQYTNGLPGLMLHCPICDEEYTHSEEPFILSGNDNYEAWEGRGGIIAIPMWCESDHHWALCLGFHKGQTWLFEGTIELE